jgi:hypothetical protein
MWMDAHSLRPTDAVREVYLTSPQEVADPAKWETLVIQPVEPGAH